MGVTKRLLKAALIGAAKPIVRIINAAERERLKDEANSCASAFQSIGSHVTLSPSAQIISPKNIAAGNNIHIGDDTYIHAEGGLQIQDNVHISRRVTIYCSDHDFRRGDYIPYGPYRNWRQVVIERNAWIGMNACILPGVRIGEGAIVGMGSVVARDVAPQKIIGQQPYRELSARDVGAYENAEQNCNYGGRDGLPALVEQRPAPLLSGKYACPEMCFVLTTGRSGSASIVDMFADNTGISARHEPRPQLIQWSTQLAHQEISEQDLLVKLRELFLETSVYNENLVYLESDQKHFNLATILKEIFPRSKFIWLTRNGADVVSSATGRGWYSDESHPIFSKIPYFYHRHRIQGDSCGALSVEEWQQMSVFERNCWYWSYVNSVIKQQLLQLPDSCWIKVRVEETDSEADRIAEHIGLSDKTVSPSHTNLAFYRVEKRRDWKSQQQKAFKRLCGEQMRKLYPEIAP